MKLVRGGAWTRVQQIAEQLFSPKRIGALMRQRLRELTP
jgi:hypothetical protein